MCIRDRSHCDSVKNGGNYDGILGVMSAMEVLETVVSENISHRHPLTAMIWTNEELSLIHILLWIILFM